MYSRFLCRWQVLIGSLSLVVWTAPILSFQARRSITTTTLTRTFDKHLVRIVPPPCTSKSLLFYRSDGERITMGDDGPTAKPRHRLSLPVLGPLLSQRAPLLPGQEFVLVDPTPMQWQTLDQCLLQHAAHVQNATHTPAGVSAAPLVALLDEYTSASGTSGTTAQSTLPTERGRYATIVAIVGLGSTSSESIGVSTKAMSNSEFMERLQNRPPQNGATKMRVRLLGIGRARLTDFFFQSAQQDCVDEEGHLLDVPECRLPMRLGTDNENEDVDVDDVDDEYHDKDTTDNIVMARFTLLSDDGVRQNRRRSSGGAIANSVYGQKNIQSAQTSPMHAMALYSQLTFAIHRLHSERQQLVSGIHAALARLTVAAAAAATKAAGSQSNENEYGNDDWEEDHDGFGMLFAAKAAAAAATERHGMEAAAELVEQQPVIDQLLRDFPVDATMTTSTTTSTSTDSSSPLASLSNFGLGASAAAVSTMASMALERMDKLKPYYSPSRHQAEEHYYELYSFGAVQALLDSCATRDMAALMAARAVLCRNTADRLQTVYDGLTEHVRLLRHEVAMLSQQLRDCGEECTDLW